LILSLELDDSHSHSVPNRRLLHTESGIRGTLQLGGKDMVLEELLAIEDTNGEAGQVTLQFQEEDGTACLGPNLMKSVGVTEAEVDMVELVLTVSNIRLVGVTLDLELSGDDTLSLAMVSIDGKKDALVSFNCLLIHPGNREFLFVELDILAIQRGQQVVEDSKRRPSSSVPTVYGALRSSAALSAKIKSSCSCTREWTH
jgi:hypothetical protein